MGLADYPVAAYQVQASGGEFALNGPLLDREVYGLVLERDDPLTAVLRRALALLMQSGRYAAILRRWDVTAGSLSGNSKDEGRQ